LENDYEYQDQEGKEFLTRGKPKKKSSKLPGKPPLQASERAHTGRREEKKQSGPRWPIHLCLLALILIPALVYGPVLGFDFNNWDDPLNILENPQVKGLTLKNLKEIFLYSAEISNYYIPLTFLSYALDYSLFGLDPGAFHRTNLILHVLNGLLVFWVFSLLSRNLLLAFLGAVLFSLHPLQVESVAWVSERKGILAAFFLLLALVLYLRYLMKGSAALYAGSLLAFLLSLLSKPIGLMFPFLLLLVDRLYGRPVNGSLLRQKIPFLGVSLLFGILSLYGQESGGAIGSRPLLAAGNLAAAGYSFLFYPGKFFFPLHLSAYYPYPPDIGFLYLLLAVALAAGIFFLRKFPEPFWGLAFFSLAVLPVIKLVPFGSFIAADRLMYFPSLGLCFLSAWALNRMGESFSKAYREAGILICAAVFLIPLSAASRDRVAVWQDSERLWKSVLELHPEAALAHTNLGMAYRREGRADDALRSFQKAVESDPGYAYAYILLGLAFEQKGRLDEAISMNLKALELEPKNALARINLGAAYMRKGLLDQAIAEQRQAISLAPRNAMAHANLGAALGQKGMLDEAIGELKQALLLDPRYAKAHYNLAVAYVIKNDRKLADYHFGRAVQLGHPSAPDPSKRNQP
jgi:tetratricopeptide (TPR) repeat protein